MSQIPSYEKIVVPTFLKPQIPEVNTRQLPLSRSLPIPAGPTAEASDVAVPRGTVPGNVSSAPSWHPYTCHTWKDLLLRMLRNSFLLLSVSFLLSSHFAASAAALPLFTSLVALEVSQVLDYMHLSLQYIRNLTWGYLMPYRGCCVHFSSLRHIWSENVRQPVRSAVLSPHGRVGAGTGIIAERNLELHCV